MSRRDRIAVLLLPVVAALVAHGRALAGGYCGYDDTRMLLENPDLAAGASWDELLLRDFWRHAGPVGMFRPLVLATFAVDRSFWDANPFGLHLTNLLLHAAASAAVAAIALRLRMGALLAGAAGVLFAVHPAHAECVSWIVGRCDGIATLGTLVALLAHLAGRPGIATLAWLGALGGKESAASAIPLVALLAWAGRHPAGASRRRAWALAGAGAGLAAALYAIARLVALGGSPVPGGAGVALPGVGLLDRLLVFARAGAAMLGSLATGAGLCADHSADPGWLRPDPGGAEAFLLAGLLVAAALSLRAARRGSLLGLGLAWVAVALLPVSQVVPIGAVRADRFLSLPAAGWSLALAAGLGIAATPPLGTVPRALARRTALAVGLTAVAAFTVLSIRRAAVWSGPVPLAEDVLRRTPNDAEAWNRLGIARESSKEWRAAEEAYRRAIAITDSGSGPREPRAVLNLGTLFLSRDRLEEAEPLLRRALRERPRDPVVHFNVAKLLDARGRFRDATVAYEAALELRPRWLPAMRNLAATLYRAGDEVAAAAAYREAIEAHPEDPGLRIGLAELLLDESDRPEDRAEALAHFRRAVDLAPRSERARKGLERALSALGATDR
ncbi:MAG: tetratricopeptide repeat protein [Planctomycetales bacterium]|nr:tetratricopeptide repeat protein [Planctomycetales bacterium]